MIRKIIAFFVQHKWLAFVLTGIWSLAGLYSLFHIPVDAVPDITNNQVQIITLAPGLSTEEVEQYITHPVEINIGNIQGVEAIRSVSRFGLSVVTLVFKEEMGTYFPRQLLMEKLSEIRQLIPKEFGSPFLGPVTTGLGEIYQYRLEVDPAYKKFYSLADLRTIQDWIIKRHMIMIPGVVEVNSFGGFVKQYEVRINPYKLSSMDISLTDILNALQKNNINSGSAYIEKNHQAYFIRGEGRMQSIDDIANTVIKTIHGLPVLIKDIGSVNEGHAIRYGVVTANGQGECVGGVVLLLKDFNANQVIVNVKEKIEEIQNILPPGIKIKPFVDRSEFISSTTSTIKENLILGALIVIFVLVFLLGSFRGGIIVASTIPLAVLFAFLLMKITGTWINLMSLGAIDFGILVDGAVIIVEGTLAYLSGKLLIPGNISPSKDNITTLAAGNMMSSAFFGQFIILIVFIPILMLQGVEGKMFKPMAYTFAFAMLGVILLCLTYVPALTALWIRHDNKKTIGEKWMEKIENSYEKFLLRLFGYRKIIYAFSFIFMASGIFLFFRSGGEFLPRLDEGDMAMHILLKPGSSVSESVKIATEVERLLKKNFPEVKQMVSRFGVSEIPTDPMPIEMGDCIITLKPKNEWTSASTKEELIEKMKQTLSIIPGVNFIFTQPIEMRFNELLSGVREDLAIKIFGDDWNTLDSIARQIAQIIKDIPGVADLKTEAISGHPQINIKILRHKLALYGLSVEDVQQTIQAIVAGIEAGQILENNKRFDLMLRFDSASSQSVESIGNIPLTTPQGHKIMLKQIADIGFVNGALQISRENTHRRSYVGVNVRNRDLASVVEDIQNKLEKKLLLPPGYRIAFGGAYENYERALSTFAWLVPIVLLTIGLLIYFAIESFRQTLLIYTAVPFAFTGGIWAIYLRDINFSISAGVGFIVLFGVAVLNGLVLFNVWNELKKNEISMKKLSVQGAKIRIRPILLTALTDILGFLPMAFSQSAGAEVQRPLATVVIGGMFTSTTLILILLPLLFYDTYSAKKTLKS